MGYCFGVLFKDDTSVVTTLVVMDVQVDEVKGVVVVYDFVSPDVSDWGDGADNVVHKGESHASEDAHTLLRGHEIGVVGVSGGRVAPA
tara:strand:- start:60 stop:323 length:264 start_codon:yes stop_codon:yes gene_type:complete